MALTITKIKEIMLKLDDSGVDGVYNNIISKILESVLLFEKELIAKLETLQEDGTINKEDVVQIVSEIRWQGLSSLAAKAGLDIGLKPSSISGEILQKYEQFSSFALSKTLLSAIEKMSKPPKEDTKNDVPATEDDGEFAINAFIKSDRKILN